MQIGSFLDQAEQRLKIAGIPSPRLDALILAEDASHKDRAWLLAHPEHSLSEVQINRLKRQVARRATHEPLAYIRGFSEFYGRRFKVSRRVLEPRPESETMIELLKDVAAKLDETPLWIADVGTGSGCLGITAALELPHARVDLYDIDSGALAVAKHNTILHELHLHAYKRDLLNRPVRHYDAVMANLPYIPEDWKINEAAALEPRLAIFGGREGLELYRRLFKNLGSMTAKPRLVLCESLPPQHAALTVIAKNVGYRQIRSQDFIQVFENVDEQER